MTDPREDLPHRRFNRLTGEWVLVSPHRAKRPWQGETSPAGIADRPAYDPDCYLCPGNSRTGGAINPDYNHTFTFPNDFPALLDESIPADATDALFRAEPARGEARVICYAPDHASTLTRMPPNARRAVVEEWCALSAELGQQWAHVQIFENKGAMMGASSPHPHGQLWASDFLPQIVAQEDREQRAHLDQHGSTMLDDVAKAEAGAEAGAETEAGAANGTRVVAENAHWIAIVPFWAAWPFETLLIARDNVARLEDLTDNARAALSAILGDMLSRYDALFATDFPYSMGWHGAPHALAADTDHWRLHAHFFPPLLRSASVRKHMVGFELLAETQRDLTPEQAAQRLRDAV